MHAPHQPQPPSLAAPQITEEQRLRAGLEAQVEALQARIAEQRVQMGGVNNSAEQAIKVRGGQGEGQAGCTERGHARRVQPTVPQQGGSLSLCCLVAMQVNCCCTYCHQL